MSKVCLTITKSELEKHNSESAGYWLLIEGQVYDVSKFLDDHPGGAKILKNWSGKDATEKFWAFHNQTVLDKVAKKFLKGMIEGAEPASAAPAQASTSLDDEDCAAFITKVDDEDTTYFGDLVPFGDPMWYQDWSSPYFTDSHRKVRSAMRNYTDKYLTPNAFDWDENKEIPLSAFKHVARSGILAAIASGRDGWPTEYAGNLPIPGGLDLSKEKWDAFHNYVTVDELCRCGSGGILYGLIGGFGIGLPPVKHFGSDELKERVIPDCLTGEKRICLAITEPEGGSDVANLVTTAEKTADGKHYIVNGAKKWITGGIYADYFVTAVRTGGPGMGGISLLVIERTEGVKTTKMNCQGVWSSGTTYVAFEDVKVPVENLLGQENKGFILIMSNFNPERIGIAIQCTRFARVCLEESIKYASKRKTFGVLLRDHPVIRAKLANMASRIESTQAWMEALIYQSTQYDADTLTMRGGGPIALLKAHSADVFAYCAQEATQIFGGLAYTRGGQGEKIERLYREVRAYTIPGGSTEVSFAKCTGAQPGADWGCLSDLQIMQDLGIRQSIKIAQIMGAKL
ncbi:BQ2448_6744 [Microbotryum intermedium]|uniref:BQ2448_6744 protein n=1 Tax=Microbotryum intermedium TaxID=269621 RepID=A0A238FKJ8_9BASI|nr:BQ2448_6744 [Microbotryum intermedium]